MPGKIVKILSKAKGEEKQRLENGLQVAKSTKKHTQDLQQPHGRHKNSGWIILGKELLDFHGGQGAAVTDLAQVGVPDHLADLGGGAVLELGGQGRHVIVEEAEDLVVVGHSAGGQVADQPAVALGGLGVGQDGEGGLGLGVLDVTASALARGQEGGSKDETLEEDSASQKAEGGGGASAEGDGGAGGGSGGGADDEGGLREVGQSQESDAGDCESVHVEDFGGFVTLVVP